MAVVLFASVLPFSVQCMVKMDFSGRVSGHDVTVSQRQGHIPGS